MGLVVVLLCCCVKNFCCVSWEVNRLILFTVLENHKFIYLLIIIISQTLSKLFGNFYTAFEKLGNNYFSDPKRQEAKCCLISEKYQLFKHSESILYLFSYSCTWYFPISKETYSFRFYCQIMFREFMDWKHLIDPLSKSRISGPLRALKQTLMYQWVLIFLVRGNIYSPKSKQTSALYDPQIFVMFEYSWLVCHKISVDDTNLHFLFVKMVPSGVMVFPNTVRNIVSATNL